MKKYIPCRKCINKSPIPGYFYIEENGTQWLVECDCHKNWRAREELVYLAEKSNIWNDDIIFNYKPEENYLGTLSKNNVNNLIKFTNNFEKENFKSASLYMYGPNGTQKTTLVQWLGLSVLRKGYSVKYMLMQQLVKLISDFVSVKEKEDKENAIEELQSLDLLILDESFNKDKVTLYSSGFQIPYIETFLKERIEGRKKATIFVSNTSPENIIKHGFSESIQNLIIRNTVNKKTDLYFEDEYYKNINRIDTDFIFN
ncbi:MAG TPA: ATP-binding protein [Bacteroidales bacterium]|nr:ATP-binding protein [Bacteroidales bacterium]